MSSLPYNVLENLREQFYFVLDKTLITNEKVIIRAKINSGTLAQSFVNAVEKETNTKFITYFEQSKPQKIIFHKKWVCHHASFRKKTLSKRDANCHAFIDILIKKVNRHTRKNDAYLKLPNPLPCVIKLNLNHSHDTDTANALQMLTVTPETKQQFEDYFSNGMKVCEARRFHESKLLANGDHNLLANGAYNPRQSQVYYIYSKWKNDSSKQSISDPFDKLTEKLSNYEKKEAIVKFTDKKPWAVLIITPVMKRAQQLPSSSKIIFVESASRSKTTESTFTIFLAATKVGGIPIAIFLHQNQTVESYINAFRLLKETASFCFGGKEAPEVFMTDNSATEKSALEAVWPTTHQLLCHFHISQAEWKWLTSASSNIPEEKRRDIMTLFQAVMYANSEEDLEKAVKAVINHSSKNPVFVNRFQTFFARQKEWVALYRNNMLTRNHKMDNISEASMRVIKDMVLSHSKAFNTVSFVDFCIDVFNNYLANRLLKFADSTLNQSLLFEDLILKMNGVSADDIYHLSDAAYLVPSSSVKNCRYIVETSIGYCTCIIGKSGAFCKHQGFLMHNMKLKLPNAPVLTNRDRYNLAKVALGNNMPQTLFRDLTENDSADSYPENEKNESELIPFDSHMQNVETVPSGNEYATQDDKCTFLNEVKRLLSFDIPKKLVVQLTKCLAKIDNEHVLNEKLMLVNGALNIKKESESSLLLN